MCDLTLCLLGLSHLQPLSLHATTYGISAILAAAPLVTVFSLLLKAHVEVLLKSTTTSYSFYCTNTEDVHWTK